MERIAVEEMDSNRLVFVGLDMSYTGTGFFILKGSSREVETIKTTPRTCENELLRIRFICDAILARLPSPDKVELICIEDYYMPNSKLQMGAAMRLVMLGTTMRLALYENGYPFYVPTASQIKKFATGKGNVPKSIVVREVFKKWDIDAADDNQADACAMAYMAQAMSDSINERDISSLAKYQIETVKKVVKERPNFNLD